MLTLRCVKVADLGEVDWRLWCELQRTEPLLESPYFRPEFVRAVASVRTDVEIAVLMRDGTRTGAIVTTRPEDRDAGATARGRGTPSGATVRQNTDGSPDAVPSDEAFYVYHRDGLPCRVCSAPVLRTELSGRTLYWCGVCQAA